MNNIPVGCVKQPVVVSKSTVAHDLVSFESPIRQPLQPLQHTTKVINSPEVSKCSVSAPTKSEWSPIKKARTFDELQKMYY